MVDKFHEHYYYQVKKRFTEVIIALRLPYPCSSSHVFSNLLSSKYNDLIGMRKSRIAGNFQKKLCLELTQGLPSYFKVFMSNQSIDNEY